jgi:hypothetical protein
MATKNTKNIQKRSCNETTTSQGRSKRQKTAADTPSNKPSAFTKNTVEDAGKMLGGGKFSSTQLKQFSDKTLSHSEKADDELKEMFIELWNRTGAEEWDEATASMFVERALTHAGNVLEKEYGCSLIVRREYPVKGRKNKGKPDLVVKAGKAIVLAVEVKADNLELGMAQNLLQIRAAYQQNKCKKIDMGTTMYGLTTTVSKWVLNKVVFKSNDKYIISQSKTIELPIGRTPISEIPNKSFGLILGCLMWPMLETANKLKKQP